MRTVGSSREVTWEAIRKSGIELIYRQGFEAMNLRELARLAGLKGAGSLYNYFNSKEDFLYRIMVETMEQIQEEMEKKVGPVEGPVERMKAFIDFHIRWQMSQREETLITQMEMRSLPPERYKRYVGLRKKYEAYVRDLIRDGCESGDFSVPDLHITAQSILTMLMGIGGWYRPNGRIKPKRFIEMNQQIVLSMLGARPSA